MQHHVVMDHAPPYRICFVCSGNICRSPIAEVVLRAQVGSAGLSELIEVDSAGTGDWHIGELADLRALQALATSGYDGAAHRARQFERDWFADRDLVIALDRGHARTLRSWAAPEERAKVRLLRGFDPVLAVPGAGHDTGVDPGPGLDVADPYYSGDEAFSEVLAQVEAACAGLLHHVRAELGERAGR